VNGVLAEANGKNQGLKPGLSSFLLWFCRKQRAIEEISSRVDEKAVHLRGLPHNGDGVLMAAEIGAAIGGTFTPEAEGPSFIGSSGHVD